MKIIITEEQKKKLFIPRKLTQDDSRYSEWNKEQPIIDGVQINQYDPEGRKQGYWMTYYEDKLYSKGNYINGLRDGYWGFYNGLGVIYQKAFYKNGKLINKNLPLTESYDDLTEGVSYSYTLDKTHNDSTKREIIYKFKNRDNYEFEVLFYNLGNGKWEREYRTNEKGLGLLKTNDVYNIIETVTEITIDFIEKYEPNKIIITHIPKNKEVDFNNTNKPNKRALLNKRYLKPAIDKLDDYFYSLNGSTSIITKI